MSACGGKLLEMKKILLTGVAGFIGSNLADRLCSLDGHRVIGIDNLAYGALEQVPTAVEFHKLDIRSKGIWPLFKNVDIVFHLAAKNCISDCQLDPVETADGLNYMIDFIKAEFQKGVIK
jgi:nucleoside-diphosphate-sugar epimerase